MSSKRTVDDPRIDKRRVTMKNVVLGADGEVYTHEATDYVRPDFLDAYVAAARANWQHVAVSEEPDAGPAGYEGSTYIPAGIDHPDANTFFPAAGSDGSDAPRGASVREG